jgi:signal transduction histidine kinase
LNGLAERRAPPAEAPAAAADRPDAERFTVLRSTRLRILTSYIVLLTFSVVVSSFATREVLIIRLNDDIDLALNQEVSELDRLRTDGIDPRTGEPFTSLRALFDVYLARNVPSSEEGMLTLVDGRIYATKLARLPPGQLPPEVVAEWEALSTGPGGDRRISGRFPTALGDAHFAATRVHIGDSVGAFVVTILPAAALGAIGDLQTYSVVVALLVLLVATTLAWLIAGRVLAPVRLLTETAQSISQSDLTHRIEVHGTGEAAEMARSFNVMLDRLEALFRDQREFVQDAGHELRDPLTICRGHLELLGDEPEERRATIALVMDELDRMARIVDDLQLLADAQQPDFVRPEPIDLRTFVRELVAKASALESRSWEVDGAADGVIVADRYRLTEAVMNLAHNAVQHTQADETVAIGASLVGDEVHMRVRDSGVGIPTSEQARVFGRFIRGPDAHRRYRGAGLGLAIVAAVAEAHGGRVELDSRLGQGSTFTIIIPTRATPGGVPRGYDPDR